MSARRESPGDEHKAHLPRTSSLHAQDADCVKPIRLLIADDHEIVRDGLVALLRPHPEMHVIAVAGNGRLAVDLWREHRPDVTLLDQRMPELEGLDALQEIRKDDATARAIILTTFDSEEEIYRALRDGANAYLLKDVTCAELLACIRKVDAGEIHVPPAVAAKLAARLSSHELTSREIEVLALLARGRSNKEIAADLFIGETTVKSHVKNLFAKLHVLSRAEAVSAATRRGMIRV